MSILIHSSNTCFKQYILVIKTIIFFSNFTYSVCNCFSCCLVFTCLNNILLLSFLYFLYVIIFQNNFLSDLYVDFILFYQFPFSLYKLFFSLFLALTLPFFPFYSFYFYSSSGGRLSK